MLSATITDLSSVKPEECTEITYIASTHTLTGQTKYIEHKYLCVTYICKHNARKCTITIVIAIAIIISVARFSSAAWSSLMINAKSRCT